MNIKKLTGYDLDDVIELLGLQRQRTGVGVVLQTLGLLTLGAIIGASAGMMFAPSSGRKLRRDVNERIDQLRSRIKNDAQNGKRELLNAVQDRMQEQQ